MKSFIKNIRNSLPVILLSLLFATGKLMAQSIQTPTIIPPSPTARGIMRYGEIPVDYSTGVPDIEIPIYTLEGSKLKVPISISYHASGIKVNDIASEVGLGWVLNCGGMVSRTVNGRRDEAKSPIRTFFNADQLMDSVNTAAHFYDSSCTCLYGIMNLEDFFSQKFNYEEDPMNDRYFYKLPSGLSGVFTYDYYDMNEDSAITLPYRPLKIEKYVSSSISYTRIDSFKITDDNGTIYKFQSYLENSETDYSEWYLKESSAADGTDSIWWE